MDRVIGSIRTMLAPLRAQLALLLTRGALTGVSDGTGIQRVQVVILQDDTHDGVERPQPYGLSTVPIAGAAAIVAALGGSRAHLQALIVDDPRCRPRNLLPGEVMVYDHQGNRLYFKQDGSWELTAVTAGKIVAPAGLLVDAPFMHCTGEIRDRVDTGGKAMSEMRETHDDHDHGGIEPGAGTTNKPNQLMGGHDG